MPWKPFANMYCMGIRLNISPGVCIGAALCLLILPARWALGFLLAAMTHELAHIAALLLCGGKLHCVVLGMTGARMEASSLTCGQSVFCSLAGPFAGISLLLLAEVFPEAALCGLVQGIYNLLPLYPLDGGRVLRLLLPEGVHRGVEVFCLIFGSGFCLWMSMLSRELGGCLAVFLWWPLIQRKFSCKDG